MPLLGAVWCDHRDLPILVCTTCFWNSNLLLVSSITIDRLAWEAFLAAFCRQHGSYCTGPEKKWSPTWTVCSCDGLKVKLLFLCAERSQLRFGHLARTPPRCLPGETQGMLQRSYLLAGMGTPQDLPITVAGSGQKEEGLGFPAHTAGLK